MLCLHQDNIMSRYLSYLNTAAQLIRQYDEVEPFASFLKKYFAQHKKHGSKDRKQIAHLCYCCFRLGKAGLSIPVEERVISGLFLCSREPNELLAALHPEWNELTGLAPGEKIKAAGSLFALSEVFPWQDEMSSGTDHLSFCRSFFVQPDLFLRLRPGMGERVREKLKQAGIAFAACENDCLALPNTAKVDQVLALNKEAVVQDYSSQQTGKLLLSAFEQTKKNVAIWDCCAASGGKSIMVMDLLSGNASLTASDIRESILVNLRKRFDEAGIKNYRSFTADVSTGPLPVPSSSFDLVIVDAPCSGSGTWSRTPEQLVYFEAERIEVYSSLQQKIVQQITDAVKPGGYLLYITCSVFKKENEEVVNGLVKTKAVEIAAMQLLKGYDKSADTLFAALLRRSS